MNNNEVIARLPVARARHDFLLEGASEMWAYGVDSAVSDSEIINWVTKFHQYVQKEKQVKAGVYHKSFLHKFIWRIRNGILQKRIKRKGGQAFRKIHSS